MFVEKVDIFLCIYIMELGSWDKWEVFRWWCCGGEINVVVRWLIFVYYYGMWVINEWGEYFEECEVGFVLNGVD